MKALTSEVPWEMSLAACPAPERTTDSTGTEQPSPRAMVVLGAALSRPLVVVDSDAVSPLLKLPLSRMPPDEDVSRHPARLSRAQRRALLALGLEPPDASGPRYPAGRPNPFGNRHQRRAHNAKARRTP